MELFLWLAIGSVALVYRHVTVTLYVAVWLKLLVTILDKKQLKREVDILARRTVFLKTLLFERKDD